MLNLQKPMHQGGFTLLEVLVSVVVLGLGLLGLAGLQATNLKNSHGAVMRTQATILAYDIIDAMRANRCDAKEGAYDIELSANAPGGGTVAQQDLAAWLAEAAARLPAGDGAITRAAGSSTGCDIAPTTVTVTLQWNDERGIGGAGDQAFVVQTQI